MNDRKLSSDPEVARAVVFLLEATLACHNSYLNYEKSDSEEAMMTWQRVVNRLVRILDSVRVALSVYWPSLFDSIHEYAFSETIPYGDEADRLVVHNSIHELLCDFNAHQLVAEMEPLRSIPLDQFQDETGFDRGAVSPLMSSVRSLRELIKELMSAEDVARLQAEYRKIYAN